MTVTFRNPLETPTIIHLHFTGNDKGLYPTMNRWRIDPWLYGDIRNLHLRFQRLYPLCRRMSPRPLNV